MGQSRKSAVVGAATWTSSVAHVVTVCSGPITRSGIGGTETVRAAVEDASNVSLAAMAGDTFHVWRILSRSCNGLARDVNRRFPMRGSERAATRKRLCLKCVTRGTALSATPEDIVPYPKMTSLCLNLSSLFSFIVKCLRELDRLPWAFSKVCWTQNQLMLD